MQLDIPRLRRSKGWLIAKRQPELGFYMINLWAAAWHGIPAASLENDDDVLADLAMCDPHRWADVRTNVLRGWVLCSDGRLYHPVVAEIATEAWTRKTAFRERTAAARKARAQKTGTDQAGSVTEAKSAPTVSVTENDDASAGSVTGTVDGDDDQATDTVDTDQQSLSDAPEPTQQSLLEPEKHAPQFLKGEGEYSKKERIASLSQRKLLDEAVAIWNATCGDVLPRAQADIPDARQVALRARLAGEMGGSLDAWRGFCHRVRAAPHLIGDNDRSWRANLDWCLKPTNMAKVIEGNFDRAAKPSPREPGQSYSGCL